jgi:hypothetical protein
MCWWISPGKKAEAMKQLCKMLGLFGVAFVVPLSAQNSQTITVTGVVVSADRGGKPIKDAVVVVHDYWQHDQDFVSSRWESKTAADGRFSFATQEVWQGCYDILVSANAQFLPVAQRVCLQAEHPQVLKIVLKSDPHRILRVE